MIAIASACVAACSGVSVTRMAPLDRDVALQASDAFMADLVSDRVADAVAKYEPEFRDSVTLEQAEAGLRTLFDYCGRPLDSELRHEEEGRKMYPDGRRSITRQFIYAGSTTVHAKGVCFFAVTIVQHRDGPRVTVFGPLKLTSGQLPDWAK